MSKQKLSMPTSALLVVAISVWVTAPAFATTPLFLDRCDPNIPHHHDHAHLPCSPLNCHACEDEFGGGTLGHAAVYMCEVLDTSWTSIVEYVAEEILELQPEQYLPSVVLLELLTMEVKILNAFADALPAFACGSGSQLTINTAIACLDGFTDDCLDHLYTGIGLCPWIQEPGSGPLDVQTMINRCNQGGNDLIGCMMDRTRHADVYQPIAEMHQCRTNPDVGPCGKPGLVHCQSAKPTCAPTEGPPGGVEGPRYCTTVACNEDGDCPSGNSCIASVCVQN